MSRVQCTDCGIPVVVDPTGMCPEGHLVGAAGARVATAIGNGVPHPDEPEPWVASVELDPVDVPVEPARTIRPPSVGLLEPEDDAGVSRGPDEDLLRELHTLAALDRSLDGPQPVPAMRQAAGTPQAPAPAQPQHTHGGSAAAAAGPAPVAAEAATPEPATDPAVAGPATSTDDLASLQAALVALAGPDSPPAPVAPAPATSEITATPTAPSSGELRGALEDLESLFGDQPASTPAPAPGGLDGPAAPPVPPTATVPQLRLVSAPLPPEATTAPGIAAADTTAPGIAAAPAAPAHAGAPAPAAAPTPPPVPAAPATLIARETADLEPLVAADPEPPAPAAPRPAATLDITNFTAKGRRVGGDGKRRLFGR